MLPRSVLLLCLLAWPSRHSYGNLFLSGNILQSSVPPRYVVLRKRNQDPLGDESLSFVAEGNEICVSKLKYSKMCMW